MGATAAGAVGLAMVRATGSGAGAEAVIFATAAGAVGLAIVRATGSAGGGLWKRWPGKGAGAEVRLMVLCIGVWVDGGGAWADSYW